MTVVNVYDANDQYCAHNIKNALEQYGTSFFDDFEIDISDSSNTKVKCKIGNNVALTLQTRRNGTNNFSFSFSDRDVLASVSDGIANDIYFLENAIVITVKADSATYYTYRRVIIIAKDINGAINVFYRSQNVYGTQYAVFDETTNTQIVTSAVTINDDLSTSILITIRYRDSTTPAGTSRVVGHSIPCYDSSATLDGVYITTSTDFSEHNYPFQYTLNGQLYTGFAGNWIVVKGT